MWEIHPASVGLEAMLDEGERSDWRLLRERQALRRHNAVVVFQSSASAPGSVLSWQQWAKSVPKTNISLAEGANGCPLTL